MTACGTDYLSKDLLSRSYILTYSIFVYFLPLFLIIYSYFFIIQAVAAHEKNMREQAKKMNVASLRSAENQSTSAECKLAKAGFLYASGYRHPPPLILLLSRFFARFLGSSDNFRNRNISWIGSMLYYSAQQCTIALRNDSIINCR